MTLTCPQLQELMVYRSRMNFDPTSLIQRHQQTLVSLCVAQPFVTQELIDAMAGCPHLQTLEMRYLRLLKSRTWLELYEKVWSPVRILNLEGIWFDAYNHDSGEVHDADLQDLFYRGPSQETLNQVVARVGPSNIQELSIECEEPDDSILQAQYWVILQTPDLRQLKWCFSFMDYDGGPIPLIASTIISTGKSPWQALESLTLSGVLCVAESFSVLIRALTQLQELDMTASTFNTGCWQ
ncbi:hypothetical protein BGZ83_005939, partial [Gryganskiella cystojenkinii]